MKPNARISAFTLIEMIGVCTIMAILAAITLPSVSETILRKRIDAEDATMKNIATSIRESLESTDLANINIASLPGLQDAAVPLTVFSSDTTQLPSSLTGNEWYVRLARLRGILGDTEVPTAVSRAVAPEVAKLALNASDQPRLLVAATGETDRQRLMLISLMAGSQQLVLPPYDGTDAWFNEIWSYSFDARTVTAPPAWAARLTADQLKAWNTASGGTNLWRLRVERITIRKFTITLNNIHPSDTGIVYYNYTKADLTDAARMAVNPLTVWRTPLKVLAGRRLLVRRMSPGDTTEKDVLQITLRENADVTVQ